MAEDVNSLLYYAQLLEYYKLKDEQTRRIDYRDHMVHIHLVLVGGAFAWALEQHTPYVFLVIPWICLIIGWSYLINDDRVTAIGNYLRLNLKPSLQGKALNTEIPIFDWEHVHRSDSRRTERKLCQFLIDELEFVLSGILAIALFVSFETKPNTYQWLLIVSETILMLGLGLQFFRYTEFKGYD